MSTCFCNVTSCNNLNSCNCIPEIRNSCNTRFNTPSLSNLNRLCNSCNDAGFFNPENYFDDSQNVFVPRACYIFFDSINTLSSEQYISSKLFMKDIFGYMKAQRCEISDVVQSLNYLKLQPTLLYICQNYGICDYGLNCKNDDECVIADENYTGYCNGVNYSDLESTNQPLINFCACHLNKDQYVNNNIECDSLCVQNQSVKLYDSFNQQKRCGTNICYISDISINVLSSTGTSVNFIQLCGNTCATGTCSRCVLKDININTVQSKVDVNIFSSCNSENSINGFECYNTVNGVIEPVKCEYSGTIPNSEDESNGGLTIIIVFSSILVVFIILFIALGAVNRSTANRFDIALSKEKDIKYNIEINE